MKVVVGLSSALAVGLAAVALANHVPPVHYGDEETEENNPSCAFFNPDWNELKIDQAPNGEFRDEGGTDNPGGDGPLVFTVKNSDGKTFDWESNMRVDAVVVKGGNRGSNVYTYGADEAKSDTALHSPDNSKGNRPAISHISACYDTRAQQQEQEQLQEEEPQQVEQEEQAEEESGGREGSKVEPVVYGDGEGEENNPSCASLNAGWNELKIDQAPNGEYRDEGGTDNPGGDGPLVFTVKNSDGKVFDWSSNIGVDAVVVKGGNTGSNVYFYDREETSDQRLQSPLNSQGNVPAISHISVCYDAEAQDEGGEEPPQEDEQPQEEEQPEDQGTNERPSDPDEPEAQEQPEEEGSDEEQPQERTDEGGTNERQAEEEQEDGATDDAEEEQGDADDPEDDAEGDVEGEFESDDGDADDIAEETSPLSDDDDSSGGQLPFTGGAPGTLLLIGFVLMLVGAAVRFAQRTKAS
jgi:type IV secretory pathway VirB10-like protein